jgi:hypothetical protein
MNFRNITLFCILAAGALAAGAQTTATPPPSAITLGTGFDYSRGDYGFTDDTEVFSVPAVLSYESGSWLFNASLSYLTIKGPATVVGGSGAPRPTPSSESGIGDIFVSATYQAGMIAETVGVSGTVRAKLPTADEGRGLGTGSADYYGELSFYRTFTSVTPFATLGYRVLGDGPTYELRNGLYAAGGAHFRLSPATVFTTLVNWRRPIIAGGDESVEGLVMASHDFADHWKFSAYALKGFTDASPEVGTGVQVSYKF